MQSPTLLVASLVATLLLLLATAASACHYDDIKVKLRWPSDKKEDENSENWGGGRGGWENPINPKLIERAPNQYRYHEFSD